MLINDIIRQIKKVGNRVGSEYRGQGTVAQSLLRGLLAGFLLPHGVKPLKP